MSIRIALHAGPVFEGENPIRGGRDFFGAHVNRAARIEPVTSPGRIYASEQLAALLTVAQSASGEHAFACDYVGSLPLDKGFGEQGLYHIRERYLEETA
jgi:class 3 adenylate cyclase